MTLVPALSHYMKLRTRYIDDTLLIIKIGSIDRLLSILNSFRPNIQCTYELEESSIFR